MISKKFFIKQTALIICVLFASFELQPQEQLKNPGQFNAYISFERLTTADGLSNNSVYDLIQDHYGFLWFATDDGLNRFDGYDFKVFRHDPSDENLPAGLSTEGWQAGSISGNSIWTIIEDSKGNIWIATKSGWVNCYDPVSEKFKKWKIESDITKENAITVIFEDSKKIIWIGTYRSGLYRLNPAAGKIDHWQNIPGDNNSLSNNYISSILEDNDGKIWISTYDGINWFNPQLPSNGFTRFYNIPGNTNSISSNVVWFLTKSKYDSNLVWIGTANGLTGCRTDNNTFYRVEIPNPSNLQFGSSASSVIEESVAGEKILWIDSYAGLVRLNISSNDCSRFTSDKNNLKSLASNQINGMIKDRSGVLWLATDNGLSFYSPKSMKFNSLLSDKYKLLNPGELHNENIKSITETSDGRTWFGTEKGLFYSNNSNGNNIIAKCYPSNDLNIWSLAADNTGSLWIGTYGKGLYRYDLKTNNLNHIQKHDKEIKIPAVNFNKVVYCDKDNNIWIGFWGFGLACLNPATGKYKSWRNDVDDKNSLSHNDVWVINQDRAGRIWIGTNGGGLNLVNSQPDLFDEKENGQFYRWTYEENKPGCLNSNSIYSICESQKNISDSSQTILWVGTNNGLNKLIIKNPGTKNNGARPEVEITGYSIKNGLAANSINCLVEDDNGNLWMGTSLGISLYEPDENKFTNFGKADGITEGDFNFSSAYKTEDGLILMGGTAGLNYFYPRSIKLSSFIPPVLITDFQIFNESVDAGNSALLKTSVFLSDGIKLSYKQNVFSFQFSALDFSSPQSIKYAYMMDGFDNDWVYSGLRRYVTYTNLNPGEYNFKVKSTNSDGIWNDNFRKFSVIITPPWWQTSWAIGLYVLIFILGIWGIVKFQSYQTRLQNELKMQEFEAHHLREIENMKSRFFANLSHEFRTPLMLIKGPLEQLISGRIKENVSHYYKMLLRNTEKLQHLIDQLLELSQLEAETIPLNKQNLNLVSLIKGFTYSFIPLAEQKNIGLNFQSSVDNITARIDRDKLEKIINNLLSNAFKYTPDGGKIVVRISVEKESELNKAIIEINDTGVGIPEKYRSKIFNRFFQVDDASDGNYSGSGIGLALVKELVTLHKWDLSVQSKEGEGSKFTLTLPLENGSEIVKEDINPSLTKIETVKSKSLSLDDYEPVPKENSSEKKLNEKPVILFVEDSQDVRDYVFDLFKHDYRVLLAEKARDGIALALKNMPDLIISDIMMAGMDGIEFCHNIKTNWQTSHIPVILLTAKATEDSKVEGLETGADDYLTKPFNYEELSARVKNLIAQRNHLREKFSKEINIKPDTLSNNTVDNEFMSKVMILIEKNLHNRDFNTEKFAEELFVSRRQLHRKLAAITGQGPGEFIRIFRLKRAAQMLLENKFSITQISLDVGFESPAQFTRAFKKHFECLPSEFNQKCRNTSSTNQN